MSSNPFIKKLSQEPKQKPNIFDKMILNQPPSSIIKPKIIFINQQNSQNVDFNASSSNSPSPSKAQPQQPLSNLIFKGQPKKSNARAKVDNAYLKMEVRVNQQTFPFYEKPAEGGAHSIFKRLSDLSTFRVQAQFQQACEGINSKLKVFDQLRQSLAPISRLIQMNYDTIHQKMSREFRPNNLPPAVITRMYQGFGFFYPSSHQIMPFLQQFLSKHPLGPTAAIIKKELHLDIVKAFYVAKETHLRITHRSGQTCSFQIEVDKSRLKEPSFISEAERFLERDKRDLLKCYSLFLGSKAKPSSVRMCLQKEETNILWSFVHRIDSQPEQCQSDILQIFLRYYQFDDEELPFHLRHQLDEMKTKMISSRIKQSLKKRLYDLNVSKMLEAGRFQQNATGPYQEIIAFLHSGHNIDFASEILKLQELQSLSEDAKWIPHFQKYILNMRFPDDEQTNLLKAVYIFKIMKKLTEKNGFISEQCEHQLLKSVSSFSTVLSLFFAQEFHSSSLKIRFIKILAKKQPSQFSFRNHTEQKVISAFLGRMNAQMTIIRYLNLIEKTFRYFLVESDLTFLERAIASGKSASFSMSFEEAVLDSIKFYTNLFCNFPSQEEKIQKNIFSFINLLRSKDVTVGASFRYYNKRLLSKKLGSHTVANHLSFALEVVEEQQLQTLLVEWFRYLAEDPAWFSFSSLRHFFHSLTVLVTKSADNHKLVEVLYDGLSIFRPSIVESLNANKIDSSSLSEENVFIFQIYCRIMEYCDLTNKPFLGDIHQFYLELRNILSECIMSPLNILEKHDQRIPIEHGLLYFKILAIPFKPVQQFQAEESSLSRLPQPGKEKYFNYPQLSSRICSYLTDKPYDTVEVTHVCLNIHPSFGKMFLSTLRLSLAQKIAQLKEPTFLQASQLIRILMKVQEISTDQTSPLQKQKVSLLNKAILLQLTTWMRRQQLTKNMFVLLFQYLTTAVNGLLYEHHIFFLQKGMQFLPLLSEHQKDRLPPYGLYLIAVMLVKRYQSKRMSSSAQILNITTEISIFTQIGLIILEQCGRQSKMEDLSQMFLMKLILLLGDCQKHPLLTLFTLQKTNILKNKVVETESLIKSSVLKTYASKIEENLAQYSDGSDNESIKLSKCSSKQQFNKMYGRSVLLLQNSKSSEQIQKNIFQLITLINNNPHLPIELIGLDKNTASNLIQNDTNVLPFLTLMQLIVKNITPEYVHRNSTFIVWFIKEVNVTVPKGDFFRQNNTLRYLISTIVQILRASLISPFLLLKRAHPQITVFIDELRHLLFTWSQPHQQVYQTLDNIPLQVDHSRLKLHQSQFTMWHLLQLRQKLCLSRDVLNYQRQMNGLSQKSPETVDSIVELMQFVRDNERSLTSSDSAAKIESVKALMQFQNKKYPLEQKGLLMNFQELKNLCLSICVSLQKLGWEFTQAQVHILSYFYPTTPASRG